MPNYCYNDIELTALTKEAADAFEAHLNHMTDAKDDDADFPGLFGYFKARPQSEDDNWYEWNIENWGTKWEVYECDWERVEDTFYIKAYTAWSPPVALFEFIYEELEDDWSLSAMYEECGMAYVGKFEDGFDECYEYSFDDESWRDDIPEELIEFAGLESSYEAHLDMLEEDQDEIH